MFNFFYNLKGNWANVFLLYEDILKVRFDAKSLHHLMQFRRFSGKSQINIYQFIFKHLFARNSVFNEISIHFDKNEVDANISRNFDGFIKQKPFKDTLLITQKMLHQPSVIKCNIKLFQFNFSRLKIRKRHPKINQVSFAKKVLHKL